MAAGIPSLNSGGGARKQNGRSEKNNFLPSFDSRGNLGVITDSNEFTGG